MRHLKYENRVGIYFGWAELFNRFLTCPRVGSVAVPYNWASPPNDYQIDKLSTCSAL